MVWNFQQSWEPDSPSQGQCEGCVNTDDSEIVTIIAKDLTVLFPTDSREQNEFSSLCCSQEKKKKALLNLAETADRIIFLLMFALPTFCFTFLANILERTAEEGRLVVGECHVDGMDENQGDLPFFAGYWEAVFVAFAPDAVEVWRGEGLSEAFFSILERRQ